MVRSISPNPFYRSSSTVVDQTLNALRRRQLTGGDPAVLDAARLGQLGLSRARTDKVRQELADLQRQAQGQQDLGSAVLLAATPPARVMDPNITDAELDFGPPAPVPSHNQAAARARALSLASQFSPTAIPHIQAGLAAELGDEAYTGNLLASLGKLDDRSVLSQADLLARRGELDQLELDKIAATPRGIGTGGLYVPGKGIVAPRADVGGGDVTLGAGGAFTSFGGGGGGGAGVPGEDPLIAAIRTLPPAAGMPKSGFALDKNDRAAIDTALEGTVNGWSGLDELTQLQMRQDAYRAYQFRGNPIEAASIVTQVWSPYDANAGTLWPGSDIQYTRNQVAGAPAPAPVPSSGSGLGNALVGGIPGMFWDAVTGGGSPGAPAAAPGAAPTGQPWQQPVDEGEPLALSMARAAPRAIHGLVERYDPGTIDVLENIYEALDPFMTRVGELSRAAGRGFFDLEQYMAGSARALGDTFKEGAEQTLGTLAADERQSVLEAKDRLAQMRGIDPQFYGWDRFFNDAAILLRQRNADFRERTEPGLEVMAP